MNQSIKLAFKASASLLAFTVSLEHAMAQSGNIAPSRYVIDENGFDILSGMPFTDSVDISIGSGDAALQYRRSGAGEHYQDYDVSVVSAGPNGWDRIVQVGSTSRYFGWIPASQTWENADDKPGALTDSRYVDSDGITYHLGFMSGSENESSLTFRATTIEYPDGRRVDIHWKSEAVVDGGSNFGVFRYYDRIQSITNSHGYQLKFDYERDSLDNSLGNEAAFQNLKKIIAINNAVEACAPRADRCLLTQGWSEVLYNKSPEGLTVTLPSGQVKSYLTNDGTFTISGDAAENLVLTEQRAAGMITKSLIRNGKTTQYQYAESLGVERHAINPDGSRRIYRIGGRPLSGYYMVEAVTFENGEHFQFEYDVKGRLKVGRSPDGRRTLYSYDVRGNLIEVREVASPDLPAEDIVTRWVYPSDCSNAVLCHKPVAVINSENKQTDYEYNARGQIISITSPQVIVGGQWIRPRTTFFYGQLYSHYGAGGMWYPLVSTESCRSSSNCSGSASQILMENQYTNQNFLLSAVMTRSGDREIQVSETFSYGAKGDLVAVGDTRGGTRHYFYDLSRRLIGHIGVDADDGGPRSRVAQRLRYNAIGQLLRAEQGQVAGTSQNALNAFVTEVYTETSFDAHNRPIRVRVGSASAVESQSDISYDVSARVQCEAVRMNPAAFHVAPASACQASQLGPWGADRITAYSYDLLGRLTEKTIGYGTADSSAERIAYRVGGTVSQVSDGNNNVTSYAYDGHGRLAQVSYPFPQTGAGSSSSADYEAFLYGQSYRPTRARRRDGSHIDFQYDALGRVVSKTPSTGQSVHYSYDLAGALTGARFGSASGPGVIINHDALGRPISETNTMGSSPLTISRGFDGPGNRVRLAHPDGVFFSYDYDREGALVGSSWWSQNSGTVPYLTIGRDSSGFRQSIVRSSSRTSNARDAFGRIATQRQEFVGGMGNHGLDFTRNSAGQLVRSATVGDHAGFRSYVNTSRGYTVNGLNQYASSGGLNLAYDANGNLISDGTRNFSYDIENRLVAVGGDMSASLRYDPLGRLWSLSRSGETTYFLHDGDQVIGEYNAAMQMTARYAFGGLDEPLLEDRGLMNCSSTSFLHGDHQGSIVSRSNCSGNRQSTNGYDAYGIPDSQNTGRFQYTGQMWMNEIGLYYYKARFYSPTLGRFLQVDPIGYMDGLNTYAYVRNDPVNFRDPLGLCQKPNTGSYGKLPTGDFWVSCPKWDRGAPGGPHVTTPHAWPMVDQIDQMMIAEYFRNQQNTNERPQKEEEESSLLPCLIDIGSGGLDAFFDPLSFGAGVIGGAITADIPSQGTVTDPKTGRTRRLAPTGPSLTRSALAKRALIKAIPGAAAGSALVGVAGAVKAGFESENCR